MMSGMLLNVVHRQVYKNIQQRSLKGFIAFHSINYEECHPIIEQLGPGRYPHLGLKNDMDKLKFS